MRILITTGIFPPDIGGPATYVPQIAKGLGERGHYVAVLTLSDSPDLDDSNWPFRVVRLPRRLFKPLRWVRTVAAVTRLGRQADVLFVNGLALEATLANIALRKSMVQKLVGDLAWERAVQNRWVQDGFEGFQQKRYGVKIEMLKALRAWWTRRADKVIVPSQYLKRIVVGWGLPDERLAVIYNAAEPMDGVRPAEVPLKTPIKAVTVGRLVPWKRVEQVLEAVAGVPELGLIVVGDGPERPRLERLAASLGLSGRVWFAGARRREETLGLMMACDVFVLNSTYEGLPHVVLEAMALGLPVVASAVGGTPELIQDGSNGLLIPAKGDGLAGALARLVADSGMRKRLSEGARRTAAAFGFASMLEATERVLGTNAEARR